MKTVQPYELPEHVTLDGQALATPEVIAVARFYSPIMLGDKAVARIQAARAVIDTLAAGERKVYGVTTGFGHLSRVRIMHDQLTELQHNLLRSHSAGVGESLSEEVTRAMMLL